MAELVRAGIGFHMGYIFGSTTLIEEEEEYGS